MTANFLQFKENGHEIWITIPPKVESTGKDGEKVETAANQTKVVSLDNLYSAAVDRKQQLGGGSGGDLASSKLPFVWKLYEMLEDVEVSKQEDIVSWVKSGKGFKVHQLEKFVEEIIPKYCKLSKYKSFQRQLYFYGFSRIQTGPDQGAYHHPSFIRGKKTLCLSMTPKNNSRRRRSSASSTATKKSIKQAVNQVVVERPSSPSSSVSTMTTNKSRGGEVEEEDEEMIRPAAPTAPRLQTATSSDAVDCSTELRRTKSIEAGPIPGEVVVEQPWDQWIAHELQDLLLSDENKVSPKKDKSSEADCQQSHSSLEEHNGQEGEHNRQPQQQQDDGQWEDYSMDYVFDNMPFHFVEDR